MFVLPSLYEGFGMALLEAQVSNLPCIASSEVPLEAKLIDNFKYLSLNDAIELWVNSIIELTDNNVRYSNSVLISKNGYDIVIEAKKLENWYLELYDEWRCKNGKN